MSDKLGPLRYGQAEQEIFLGRDYGHQQTFSDTTARIIDEEVRHIVETGAARAEAILRDKVDALHRMATALLERETLDAGEIDLIMNGQELPPFSKDNRAFNLTKAVETLKKAAENKPATNGHSEATPSTEGDEVNTVGPGDKGDAL
jgi:cell division protease FtsH